MTPRTATVLAVSALAALAVAASVSACGDTAPAPPTRAASPLHEITLSAEGIANAGIRSARLTPETFSPHLAVTATVTADQQHVARVGSRVPGRVAAIDIQLGDQVTRGQSLVEIDAVELHEVTLEFLTASARAREATDALGRQRQLVAERVGAVQDLRRAEADAAAATAALHEADEHLHFLGLSERDLGRLRRNIAHGDTRSVVRAPIDGRVEALDVALGQVLAGTEDIVTIAQLETVWATLRVYERDLAGVTVGTRVEVQVPSYPTRTFPGVIEFVGDLVDPETRTVEARASLDNADGALRPGMSATALLALRGAPDTLWLPVEAVQPAEGGSIAFVRVAERRFEPRRVVVGDEQGGFVPVSSGIAATDEVVVAGAFALRGELERAELEE